MPTGDPASQHPGFAPRLLAPAEGPLEPLPRAWGYPKPRTCWLRDPGVLGCLTPDFAPGTPPPCREGRAPGARAGGGVRGSPLPRLRGLGSLCWARASAPTRALAGRGLRRAARRGEGGEGGGRAGGAGGEGSPQPGSASRRSAGDREGGGDARSSLSAASCFHPTSIHASIRSFIGSRSVRMYVSGPRAFRAHLLCAGGPRAAWGAPARRRMPAPPHLAQEEDGTGGSQE